MKCHGFSGSNSEYVTRLADFVRHHIPQDDDQELFQLDSKVRRLLTSDISWSRNLQQSTLANIAALPGAGLDHTHSRVAVNVVAS